LDRQKALALLHDILEATGQMDVKSISLDSSSSGDFSLLLESDFSDAIKNRINPILISDNLEFKRDGNFLIIFSETKR
jgi:hypothetical protein